MVKSAGGHGSFDAWVVKLDEIGEIQWQNALGGSAYDRANEIRQTADGGFILAGSTYSSDGDVTSGYGDSDAWVVKLDATGELQWEKALGGQGLQYAVSIDTTSDGGYVMGGVHNSNGGDHWVVKFDAYGEVEWERTLGSQGLEGTFCIRQTPDDGFILTGDAGHVSGDVTENHGEQDFWLVKLGPYELATSIGVQAMPLSMVVHPNPFTDQFTINVHLNTAGKVELVIHDALGRSSQLGTDQYRPAGMNAFMIDAQGLPSGVLHLRLSLDGQVITRKVVKLRD